MNPSLPAHMQPKRAALYLRVSTDDQTTDPQRDELIRYCHGRGWTIVKEYRDHGESGASIKRAALDELMRDVKTGVMQVVVVVKIDRLSRSLNHFVFLIDEMRKADVAFVATSQSIDTTYGSATGIMQLQLLAVFAQFERGMISERVKAGLASAKAKAQREGRSWTIGRPSLKLRADCQQVVAQWYREHRATKVTGLAQALGGVSVSTAWTLLNRERKSVLAMPAASGSSPAAPIAGAGGLEASVAVGTEVCGTEVH